MLSGLRKHYTVSPLFKTPCNKDLTQHCSDTTSSVVSSPHNSYYLLVRVLHARSYRRRVAYLYNMKIKISLIDVPLLLKQSQI